MAKEDERLSFWVQKGRLAVKLQVGIPHWESPKIMDSKLDLTLLKKSSSGFSHSSHVFLNWAKKNSL